MRGGGGGGREIIDVDDAQLLAPPIRRGAPQLQVGPRQARQARGRAPGSSIPGRSCQDGALSAGLDARRRYGPFEAGFGRPTLSFFFSAPTSRQHIALPCTIPCAAREPVAPRRSGHWLAELGLEGSRAEGREEEGRTGGQEAAGDGAGGGWYGAHAGIWTTSLVLRTPRAIRRSRCTVCVSTEPDRGCCCCCWGPAVRQVVRRARAHERKKSEKERWRALATAIPCVGCSPLRLALGRRHPSLRRATEGQEDDGERVTRCSPEAPAEGQRVFAVVVRQNTASRVAPGHRGIGRKEISQGAQRIESKHIGKCYDSRPESDATRKQRMEGRKRAPNCFSCALTQSQFGIPGRPLSPARQRARDRGAVQVLSRLP